MTEAIDSFQSVLILSLGYLVIIGASGLLAALIFPSLLNLFNEAGLVKPNYLGEKIPVSGGILFIVMIPVVTLLGMLFKVNSLVTRQTFLFLFVLIAMGFIGFFDDQLGNHSIKGFRGHFRKLFVNRQLTTGAFKALFGLVIALVFSYGTADFVKGSWQIQTFILNFLLVALAANCINLFDLRPGRASKIYLFGFILILLFSKDFESYIGLFLPVLAILIYYLPFDLKGKVMLGDSGANFLGASLGVMMAWMLSDLGKTIAVIILISLHILAEKFSFSEIISEYRILRYLDELGRRKEH